MGYRDRILQDTSKNKLSEDEFGFLNQAENIAKLVMSEKQSMTNLVVGISGTWGSGKSSMLNFIEELISNGLKDSNNEVIWKPSKKPIIVKYDPWFFGKEEQVIESFFISLVKKIIKSECKLKYDISKLLIGLGNILKYSESISEVSTLMPFGFVFKKPLSTAIKSFSEIPTKIANSICKQEFKDFFEIKEELIRNLAKISDHRIIIIIDDLDRLQLDETLTMLKIIRLITDLPNINTIVAFDEDAVSNLISLSCGNDGRQFLRKMINVPTYLPTVNHKAFLHTYLDNLINNENFSEQLHILKESELFKRSSKIFNTAREVKNLINMFIMGLSVVGKRINTIDYYGLCLLYLYFPNIYYCLRNANWPFVLDKNNIICFDENVYNNKDQKSYTNEYLNLFSNNTLTSNIGVEIVEQMLINKEDSAITNRGYWCNYFTLIPHEAQPYMHKLYKEQHGNEPVNWKKRGHGYDN